MAKPDVVRGGRLGVGRPPGRALVAGLLAAVLATGCGQPVASRGGLRSPDPSGARLASPGAIPSGRPTDLANALRDAIDIADIRSDLQRLSELTVEHGGARPAGSAGHDAAAEFVADELRRAGFVVELQPVEVVSFKQDAPSVLEVVGTEESLEDLHDFKAMFFSASGDVRARVVALGYDPDAEPGARNGVGCDAADWANVPRGVIVLAQPATCARHDVIVQAQKAGVLAVVTSYPEWTRDTVLRPTLLVPADITIPALGATRAVGEALAQAAANDAQVHLSVHATTGVRSSMNVIGETPGGDPAHVLVIGGHLDSVIDGPGMNDNGTGTMTSLEIARELASAAQSTAGGAPGWKVRVAFWTGEETGIFGSRAYVRGLAAAAHSAIQAYLNFDMLGSPNGVRVIYAAEGTMRPREGAVIQDLFEEAFDGMGLASQTVELGVSDHIAFAESSIAIGGLFSGATEPKSADQAALFGGTAGALADPCYHLACDTLDNIDMARLEEMARAAAWVVGALASGEIQLAPS